MHECPTFLGRIGKKGFDRLHVAEPARVEGECPPSKTDWKLVDA